MIYSTNYGVCPVCNKRKGVASHKKCSRILQKQRNQKEWETILSNEKMEELKQEVITASTERVRRINYIQGYQK